MKYNYEGLDMFKSINEDMLDLQEVDHVDNYRDLLRANGHTVAPVDEYEAEDWMADEYDRVTGC